MCTDVTRVRGDQRESKCERGARKRRADTRFEVTRVGRADCQCLRGDFRLLPLGGIAVSRHHAVHGLTWRTGYPWLFTLLSLFSFCIVVGFFAALVARYDSVLFGWFGVVIGIAFLFGGTLAISFLARAGNIHSDANGVADPFVTKLLASIPNIGIFLISIALLNLVLGYAIQLMYMGGTKGATQLKFATETHKKGAKPSLIPKCWEMSRCRPGVRETCPNYLDLHTCWKRRSGCFCDRDLANYLVGSVDRKEVQEVIDVQLNAVKSKKATAIRSHLEEAGRRPWRQQKVLCHACPLYVEHQEYKYKYWHWVSFPVTALIIVLGFDLFHAAYMAAVYGLNDVMQKLIKMGGLPDNFIPSTTGLADSPFQFVLLGVLGVLLASYVVALTDMIFLKWKL